ncbi:hypothetical protein Pd630_LPD07411 [Rhodococcus opacus PD630]|nr:hypothetical protein Pd630_LPD07411 [Rhodococcus opacus PD630]
MVARLEADDTRADLADYAGALVTADNRESPLALPLRDRKVGMTDARCTDLHEYFPLIRPVEVDVLDVERLARREWLLEPLLEHDGCLHAHRIDSSDFSKWATSLDLKGVVTCTWNDPGL